MLNEYGRWILEQADYRVVGLTTLLIVVVFVVTRRVRYGRWPGVTESQTVLLKVLSIFSALAVGIVFLLTKPPAIDILSSGAFSLIGLVTLISVIGPAGTTLIKLFNPELDQPPPNDSKPS